MKRTKMTPTSITWHNVRGSTLTELMIVIAIFGVLATVAVPNFLAYRNKTRVAATIGSGEGVRTAFAGFAADSIGNSYPPEASITTYDELTTYVIANGSSLPQSPQFRLMSYTTADNDGDTLADDYSIRLSVNHVDTPINGGQVLVTPGGIFRCAGSTTLSCDN